VKNALAALFLISTSSVVLAAQAPAGAAPSAPSQAASANTPTVKITSPLGRTGVGGKVRIVAQVRVPIETTLSPLQFFVDGELVGSVASAPYAVDWIDENPFEPREITVQAADAAGRVVRDSIHLPGFKVTDSVEVKKVLLEAGVYDRTGRTVPDLERSAFRVLEDGVVQTLDLVSQDSVPATLVVLVDNSQSMSRRMDFVRHATERLASGLRSNDKVIIAPFTERIKSITGPTGDRDTIVQAVEAMKAGGFTSILDALLDGIKLLDGADGRRAIVLLTDGYDERSKNGSDAVLEAAQDAHVTLYVVGIGGVAGISLKGERLLRQLAEGTGGRLFFPPREVDLPPIAETVVADSHGRYLLTYTPTNQTADGAWRAVSVEVAKGYQVKTRPGYFAPKPAPIHPDLEFTVIDRLHRFVDIAADDLQVVENGKVQKIDTFQEAIDPVSIVLALDASGSMKRAAEAVQQAARDFVLSVKAEDSLSLVTFADTPVVAHELSTDRRISVDAIDQYQALGGTALYDALWLSVNALKSLKGRKVIVILTDGRDENNPGTGPGSEHTLEDVLELQRTVGATIFSIGLGSRVDREGLTRLSVESGGEALFPAEVSLLPEQYRRVVENLRRRYVIGYTSTNLARDGSWRKVEIKARDSGLTVQSRGGYFAPAQ
jgi:VWFA-related protein